MAQPNSPPPRRHPVLTFPSPKAVDLVFYELRDGTLPKYANPVYGQAHEDAAKFPNHVLVFIAPWPEDEHKWQRWYYAAARDNQDDYNFELDSDTKLQRTYLIPRADYVNGAPDYVAPTEGDEDASYAGYRFSGENVVRTDDRILDSYFVVVRRTYVNTGKIISQSISGSPRGESGGVTSVGHTNVATAVAPGIILERSSRETDSGLWQNTENRLALRTGVNQLSQDNRVGYREIDSSELTSSEPLPSGEVSFSKRLVTTDVAGSPAVWAANRKLRENRPSKGSEMVTSFGGGVADVDVRLVSELESADSGFTVLESRVTPLGNGDAIKTTKTLSSYPTLIGYQYDASLDALVKVTKDVVAAGTAGTFAVGDITEIQPFDKWRSISIRTEGVGVESTTYLPGVFSFQFPPVLVSAQFITSEAYATHEGESGTKYDWDFDMALVFDVREAFSAAVNGRVIRVVTSDPASVIGAYKPVNFKPQSHTIGFANYGYFASEAIIWAKASARTWQTPMALCPGITITFGGVTGGAGVTVDASYTSTIPATDPRGIPLGWITVGASSNRLRLGYYEVLIRQIESPGG